MDQEGPPDIRGGLVVNRMPSNKEIILLINQIRRSLNCANHGMIEVSVDAAKDILNVLIAYLAEQEGGESND